MAKFKYLNMTVGVYKLLDINEKKKTYEVTITIEKIYKYIFIINFFDNVSPSFDLKSIKLL